MSDDVTVIDGVSNTVVASVYTGDFPDALCFNAINNKVYCANFYGNSVSIIDGVSNTVITTVPVGMYPQALFWNPVNNKIYCANRGSGNVTIIDGATNSVVNTLTVDDGPWAFAWDSLTNRTFVSNYYGSTLSVLRDQTGVHEYACGAPTILNITISPNPFSKQTTITFTLNHTVDVLTLGIYDVTGRLVRAVQIRNSQSEIRNSIVPTTYSILRTVLWNGTDDSGRPLPSGVYYFIADGKRLSNVTKIR